jgi:hypothetical protein
MEVFGLDFRWWRRTSKTEMKMPKTKRGTLMPMAALAPVESVCDDWTVPAVLVVVIGCTEFAGEAPVLLATALCVEVGPARRARISKSVLWYITGIPSTTTVTPDLGGVIVVRSREPVGIVPKK